MVSLLTLGLIVGVTIFAPRRLKLFAVFIGASHRWILAAMLGVHRPETAEVLAAADWIALPHLHLPSLAVAPSLLPLAALMVMMNLVDVLGVTVSLEKMNDADWRRPICARAGRAVNACGIGNILNGLTSGLSVRPVLLSGGAGLRQRGDRARDRHRRRSADLRHRLLSQGDHRPHPHPAIGDRRHPALPPPLICWWRGWNWCSRAV